MTRLIPADDRFYSSTRVRALWGLTFRTEMSAHKHGICSMTTVVRCPRTGHAWPNSTAKFRLSALAQYLRCHRVERHRLRRMQAVEQTRRAADYPRTEMSAHKHAGSARTHNISGAVE